MSLNASTRRPLWLGLVLTPLITPAVFVAFYALYYAVMGLNRPGQSWTGSLLFSYVFGVPLGFLAIGALGWPLLIQLQRWRKLAVGYVCAGASLIGVLAFLLFALLVGYTHSPLDGFVERSAIGLGTGLIAGLIFCAITGVPFKTQL